MDPNPPPPPPANANPALPGASGPVALDRPSAVRTEAAVKYVERMYRGRPRKGRRRDISASGAWAYLASGSISAASGSTLGSGTVQICSRSGATLTADGDNVTVYNAGGSVSSPKYIQIAWTDGAWGVVVVPCS